MRHAACGEDDDALSELQEFLRRDPEAGDIVKDSGGVRKMRWSVPGRGKRFRAKQGQIWLLTLYPESEKDSIPGWVLRKIKDEIDDEG